MQNVEKVIKDIQQGDESSREVLIASYRPFILKYTSFICKRALDWTNDDELSIALIAFNRAIDKYQTNHGHSFSAYARVLIKNSLIDFFRKQPDCQPLSLEAPLREGKITIKEEVASLESYKIELENRDRAFELQIFKEELAVFGLTLTKLPELSPNHKETRKHLKELAQKIVGNAELTQKIYRDKKLPLKEIQVFTGVPRKSLGKWRKYLLALVIILTNPDLEILAEYIWGKEVHK